LIEVKVKIFFSTSSSTSTKIVAEIIAITIKGGIGENFLSFLTLLLSRFFMRKIIMTTRKPMSLYPTPTSRTNLMMLVVVRCSGRKETNACFWGALETLVVLDHTFHDLTFRRWINPHQSKKQK